MKAAVLCALLLAGCGSSARCVDLVHSTCDLDGGSGCGGHQSCIPAPLAIDPCAAGASGCCFDACAADKDCSGGQRCVGGSCVQGRCAADAGP